METGTTIVTSLRVDDLQFAHERAKTTHESVTLVDVTDRLEVTVDDRGHVGFRALTTA